MNERHFPSDVAFSEAVKAQQQRLGSRGMYEQVERGDGWIDQITPMLAKFIAERDSFYFGTASADGQPYIQHRGGPPGFLKVVDDKTLAFADFEGNRQYISIGNLSENDKAIIFLIDYPNRRRIKIWGTAEAVENDAALIERLFPENYQAKATRVIRFHVIAWDMNCKSHIQPRFSQNQVAPLVERIEQLEAEVKRLRQREAERQQEKG
jgi:predicted pyridoxine 5'-phosphate oxidase superfamily flavin-nucleotide-binding protein